MSDMTAKNRKKKARNKEGEPKCIKYILFPQRLDSDVDVLQHTLEFGENHRPWDYTTNLLLCFKNFSNQSRARVVSDG